MSIGAITPQHRAVTPEVETAVAVLFVPGDRPERFAKACAAGADAVIIDLEDAVDSARKQDALKNALAALAPTEHGSIRALVRVNTPGSAWFGPELEALAALADTPGNGLLGVVVPKAEDPAVIAEVRRALPVHAALIPLVESALGAVNALDIARVPGVARLAFGAVDYTLDIDTGEDPAALVQVRSTLVMVSRAAGIAPPLDSPSTAIRDLPRIDADAALGRSVGFGGKLCIHPVQVERVRAAYAPTGAQVAWAATVLGVSDSGAAQVEGEMIDRPVLERARRILARAGKEPA
ncbi:HpcH/HpaI aldolase/citrate lyase family protein [Specibacter cremeus]|uniref:HpcH/HpaI aldolase/citrate lyase family protein n=1 Tax=Specibacter cremeus TaxID=1629051 RepID=UPI000F765E81|nr:CoA ester lyase [Specibacter cremeus]